MKNLSQTKLPSNRNFGLFFSFVFLALTVKPLTTNETRQLTTIIFTASLSSLLLFISFLSPNILTIFNRTWFRIGQLMGKIISPIVVGSIFFLFLSPLALFLRIIGRDELKIRKKYQSTWSSGTNTHNIQDSFNRQY